MPDACESSINKWNTRERQKNRIKEKERMVFPDKEIQTFISSRKGIDVCFACKTDINQRNCSTIKTFQIHN
ncbi:MAG: hypothetical protein LUB59_02750, partial [Candidatus Gastranaerophilales bacterium]|nr:hypothetical protein [Candidatus Gastranaerophilales bacterium]